MNHHLLAQAIKSNDIEEYQRLRYPRIQEGEEVEFTNEDFSGTDFSILNLGFHSFLKCKLDGCRNMYGQPIKIISCSAKNLDLRGCEAAIDAIDSDFIGLVYDQNTHLSNKNSSQTPSTFFNCKFEPGAISFFESQGVVFK